MNPLTTALDGRRHWTRWGHGSELSTVC